jgi:DNA-binding MarR family transcriptional regulator
MSFSLGIDDDITKLVEFDIIAIATTLSLAQVVAIAITLVLQRSNLTRLVDRLENAELVRRQVCDTDRRGAFAEITPDGLAMRQRIWQVYGAAIAKYFASSLSTSEVEMFARSLNQILANSCN